MLRFLVLLLSFVICLNVVFADETSRILTKKLSKLGVKPDSVKQSPIPGLYQVMFGAELFYISADGRYVMRGNMIDLYTRTNLTEQAQNNLRKAALDKVKDEQMIIYPPKDKRHTITVFTDIDCPYCRQLNSEMQRINTLGIEVRYLLFPRTGIGSPSYDKAVSVFCAEDQTAAMDAAMLGKPVKKATCENPVNFHYMLGQAIGVVATPATVLEDGRLLLGYRPAQELAQILNGTVIGSQGVMPKGDQQLVQ